VFEEELEEYEGFSIGKLMKTILWENPLSRWVIRPVFSFTGRAIGYILPESVKKLPKTMY